MGPMRTCISQKTESNKRVDKKTRRIDTTTYEATASDNVSKRLEIAS